VHALTGVSGQPTITGGQTLRCTLSTFREILRRRRNDTRVTKAQAKDKLRKGEEIIEVWEKDPKVQAFTDLMNRCIDKPKEQKQEVAVAGNWDELAANLMRARDVIQKKGK